MPIPRFYRSLPLPVLIGLLGAGPFACASDPPPPAQAPPPGYAASYPPTSPPAYPTPSAAPTPAVSAAPLPPPPATPPQQPIANDPLTLQDLNFMRQQAQETIRELVAALPSAQGQRVIGIPLIVDDTPGEVNAFASCANGKAAMAISDGLLRIEALLAQAQAHDEVFRTNKVNEYIQFAAARLKPKTPIPQPPAGFFPGATDPRVVARQHQLFEEQVAFVLGHELGHHHLGHLPCTAAPSPLGAADVARMLSDQVPLFNQPNELAADIAGTNNVLAAGRARAARGAHAWTEGGGLLTMRFFAGFNQLTPGTLLTAFERSHPPPQLRTPVIQTAANNWRSTGGTGFQVPGLSF